MEDDHARIVRLTRPIMAKYAPERAEQMLKGLEDDRVIVMLRPERIVTN